MEVIRDGRLYRVSRRCGCSRTQAGLRRWLPHAIRRLLQLTGLSASWRFHTADAIVDQFLKHQG